MCVIGVGSTTSTTLGIEREKGLGTTLGIEREKERTKEREGGRRGFGKVKVSVAKTSTHSAMHSSIYI